MAKTGRPKGSKNKFPTYAKLHDAFLERGLDPAAELAEHYFEMKKRDERALMQHALKLMFEFVYPKPRPVDPEGKAESPPTINITAISDDELNQKIKELLGGK
jgi:hypothetical protein